MGIVNRRLNYYCCCKNRKKVFSLLRSNDNIYIIYIHKSRQVFFTNSYFRSAWPERLDNLIFVIRVHLQFCESVHFKLVLLYTEVILYMRTCALYLAYFLFYCECVLSSKRFLSKFRLGLNSQLKRILFTCFPLKYSARVKRNFPSRAFLFSHRTIQQKENKKAHVPCYLFCLLSFSFPFNILPLHFSYEYVICA